MFSTLGTSRGVYLAAAFFRALLFEAITAISSFQELTNDFAPSVLERGGQSVDIDSGVRELRQHLLAVTPVCRQGRADFAVIGESFQCSLGHRVHGEGRSEGLDVKDVGGLGIFGSSAGPKEPLRTRAGIENPLPTGRVAQQIGKPCTCAWR